MFFEGSLQEGIALAVRDTKTVVCFVRDDEPASSEWEEHFFAVDDEFAQVLAAKAVLLRLTAGSQEAGFLTSFCPIPKVPAVVVIKNGAMREYLVPDVSKEDFQRRLKAALAEGSASPVAPAAPRSPAAQQPLPASPAVSSAPHFQSSRASPTQPDSASSQTQVFDTQPLRQQAGLNANDARDNRRSSAEQQLSVSHNSASQPRQKRSAARSTAAAVSSDGAGGPSTRSSKPAPKSHKSIDVDSTAKTPSGPDAVIKGEASAGSPARPAASPPKQYRLQVRLFDGTSVRSTFSPSQNISADVRPWLDSQMADEKRPYNLKHILTPLPNRTLTIAEEQQSLEEIGLGPTASLVMVPISTYTEAYAGAGSSLPVRGAYAAYDMVSSAVGAVSGMLGSFWGAGQGQPAAPAGEQPSPAVSTQEPAGSHGPAQRARPSGTWRGPNIRTLRDQQEERGDRQFYNGNQLNFEPRSDNSN